MRRDGLLLTGQILTNIALAAGIVAGAFLPLGGGDGGGGTGSKARTGGDLLPAADARYNVGAPDLRWDQLYLMSQIDAAGELVFTSDGVRTVAIDAAGNVRVAGDLEAAALAGDGSRLTGLRGAACWDADADGVKDASEDLDGDGSHTAMDCVGPSGRALAADILLTGRIEGPDTSCPGGTHVLQAGYDDGPGTEDDNVLQENEVDTTAILCQNGLNTPPATARLPLLEASSLPVGSRECPYGGVLLTTGSDRQGDGRLDTDEVVAHAAACNGGPGVATTGDQGPAGADGAMGATGGVGPAGPDGFHALATARDATTAECPDGGLTFTVGLDDGMPDGIAGDRVLQDPEVEQTVSACDGARGPQGIQGIQGATGPQGPVGLTGGQGPQGTQGIQGVQGPQGPVGPAGPTGDQGPPGSGHNSLLERQALGAGDADCPAGGQAFQLGLDDGGPGDPGATAWDWTLQQPEWESQFKVCDGERGPQGIQGVMGPEGPPADVGRRWIPTVPRGDSLAVVDSGGDVGEFTSVTVGADGLAVIAYYDRTNGDLKVAKCNNVHCSSSAVTTVDSAGDVGQYASIVVRPNGLPAIAYYDATNGDLKMALCGNPTCDTGNSVTVVDDGTGGGPLVNNDVGQYVVLGMVSGGMSWFYYDATDTALKWSVCNTLCNLGSGTGLFTTAVDGAGAEDVGRYIATAGNSAYYFDATNGDIKSISCGGLACNPPTVLQSGVDVGSPMAYLLGSVYYYDPTIGGFGRACTGCTAPATPYPAGTNGFVYAAMGAGFNVLGNTEVLPPPAGAESYARVRACATCTMSPPATGLGIIDSDIHIAGDVAYPSITVDPYEYPIVAFHDETNGDLLYQRYGSPSMNAYSWRR